MGEVAKLINQLAPAIRELGQFIAMIGLPGFICIYLLWSWEKRFKDTTEVLRDMTKILGQILEAVKSE